MSNPDLILQPFIGQLMSVDTPVGMVQGTLLKADCSRHGGVGNLLLESLESQGGWLLVKAWIMIAIAIKRRLQGNG